MMQRRTLLGGLAAAPLALPAMAQASAQVTMCVWGGGGALVWRESFVQDFTAATGLPVRIVEVPNTAGALRSPVANTQYNLALVTYFEAVELARAGTIETFTAQDLPSLQEVEPRYHPKTPGGALVGVPVYFTFYGVAFNTTLAKADDFGSWNDLADPRWRGRIAITRPVYAASYDLVIMAKARGGDERNVAPGMPLLRDVAQNSLTTYSSLAHMNTLLTRAEVAAVPYYASRVWSLRRQGSNEIDIALPREGVLMLPYVIVAPKGLRNRDATLRWLNYTGTAAGQAKAAAMDGWLPMNRTVTLPPETERVTRMPLSDIMSRLYAPDWGVVAANQEARVDEVERMMASIRR
jgi:putative spermidine/putrescine transport system substrate-binding protein